MTIGRRHTLQALALLPVLPLPSFARAAIVPGAAWKRVANPKALGWSTDKLHLVRRYGETLQTAAMVIVANGQVLDEWGETARRYNVGSVRKSFLSALIGTAVADGKIRLNTTLAALGIDDNEPSLSEPEKRATVADLIKARSGIFHAALYETPEMAASRPARGSHTPGTHWYYNNWDFNALGTIYEQRVGASLFEQFRTRIAKPIGMQDYRVSDGEYVAGGASVHRAYPFRMTARDMARFGLLFARGGRWGDRQVVPRKWVQESTRPHSIASFGSGYGYMWWATRHGRHLPGVTLPEGSYSAQGRGGDYILVVPSLDLVIVHRVDTDRPGREVSARQFGELVRLVLDARNP